MYADVERLLVALLPGLTGGVRACTDLPADLLQVLPVVQVARIGGTDSSVSLDVATVDVDSYAASRQAANELAGQVRHALLFALPGAAAAGGVVTRVQTLSAPAWRPYDNTTLRRVGASYQLTVRATAAL